MQVLNDDDKDGLVGYGKIVNKLLEMLVDGDKMAEDMGLTPDQVNIEPAVTMTHVNGHSYRFTLTRDPEEEEPEAIFVNGEGTELEAEHLGGGLFAIRDIDEEEE